jgi:adenosine deaminase
MTLELAKHFSGLLVEGLKRHPQLEKWLETKHPISIGTDDPGVFHTDATKELILLHKAWNVNRAGLQRIVLQSMDFAFCSDGTRSHIKDRMQDRLD